MALLIEPLSGILGGLVLLYLARRVAKRAQESTGWPTVDGEITESAVVRRGKNRVHTPIIRYTYSVNGERFIGRRLNVGPATAERGDPAAARVVARFPPGARVRVAVDPKNPSYAVLLPGVPGGHRLLLFVGGVFLLTSLYFLISNQNA